MNAPIFHRRLWPLLLAVLLLAGCGFHLRGAVALPPAMQKIAVKGIGPYAPLGREIRRGLRSAGAEVVEDPAAATAVLRILRNEAPRRVLSVQATGKVQEYELLQILDFSVQDAAGRLLLSRQHLELSRAYLYDANDPLGKGSEEAAIRADMRRDLVQLLLLRLQARGR
ncbi:LPS assembly lipoprotein LptE [Thiohalobacter sp. IOR34]|uniref:LPS-assembly lipoprotein LptE n=1 Tax=Thiohalobacter sp. IOR34 TaxID=3057176 RepID=UPI0025B1DD75|nr:LPS assembly lipoprotein LptE [Thiohalobacter sp. IOR34]WJW74882.1 LPS assembly lipoprotein LptE [Thiohalobacter sp. IOR34]